jgi:hypothetical protein
LGGDFAKRSNGEGNQKKNQGPRASETGDELYGIGGKVVGEAKVDYLDQRNQTSDKDRGFNPGKHGGKSVV